MKRFRFPLQRLLEIRQHVDSAISACWVLSKKLIEARKEKRILERLREKSLQKYFYELRKEEQNFFDEVGTNRFARKDIGEKSAETKKHKIEIPLKLPEREDLTKKMYEEIISGEKE